jgi:tetratricopeptide (TPR) repeat protein
VLRAAISDGDQDRHTTHPPAFQQTLFSNIKVHEDDRVHLETMSLVSQKYLQQERLDIPEQHLGEFLLQCGRYKGSLMISERVLKVRETNLGVNDLGTLVAMDIAAINYYCVGNLELAETLIRKAFNLKHALLGPEHNETLISLCELATTLNFAGKFEEAQALAETARESRTRSSRYNPVFKHACESTLWPGKMGRG